MTGYANLNSAKDAIKEGAYDYILKPFELNEMRQAVKNAVDKKQKDTEETISSELTRLSDLNQLMYTVGERKSLVRLSLGFAMMQTKARKGSIIYRTSKDNEIGITATADIGQNIFDEYSRNSEVEFFSLDPQIMGKPFTISTLTEHPVYNKHKNEELADILIPPWYETGDRLINVALCMGQKLYGFLILNFSDNSATLKDSDLKFLTITANQIAISLENIALLEESRDAYSRLKELQEQTIQLEKIATRGQMSAEIGHELNNYLGVVAGNLSLLQHLLKEQDYDEMGKYILAAINNLDKISKFSRDLMEFSEMESNFENYEINTLIRDTIEYVKTQKQFKDISIGFENSARAIFAEADPSQFQQLLYNLINNAGDAIREKGAYDNKQINIATTVDTEKNRYTIAVSDNGIGMAKEHIETAFKKQFTTKKTGHGFGLLVCRRIIENHNGKLNLDSAPNKGTSMTISFPLVLRPEPEAVPV
jgi:signal transduction histidine kinase